MKAKVKAKAKANNENYVTSVSALLRHGAFPRKNLRNLQQKQQRISVCDENLAKYHSCVSNDLGVIPWEMITKQNLRQLVIIFIACISYM